MSGVRLIGAALIMYRWQTALHHAASPLQPTPATGLIRLFPGLLAILGENMDLLPKMLELLDSYLLLDAAGIISVRKYSILSLIATVTWCRCLFSVR